MLVQVWSDVVCPWCYIGKRRFEKAVDQLRADESFDEEIEVVFRPFQLDPTAPPGTSMPVAEAYARKFGGPERAAAIIGHVSEVAAGEGLEFHLDRAKRANTRDAHRLLGFAEEHGPPGTQEAVKERLLAAYFVNGEDIGDHDLLVTAAGDAGLDVEAARAMLDSDAGVVELRAALESAIDKGITAVPTYVIDGRWSIPGAQDPDVFVQVIRRVAERSADRAG
ncbi:MAG: DsbA family oxidoreductase [Ilumatobacteraceae bacterium]